MEGRERRVRGSMRQLAAPIILATVLGLSLGCTPTSSAGEEPDDIVYTPGGITYRANVHEQGVANPWPSIQSSTVVRDDNVTITYRADIETRASESRNNIVFIKIPDRYGFDTHNLNLSADNVPDGIHIEEGEGGGGLPGIMAKVLIIEISKGVKPGEYSFEINVEFEGESFGEIPCTLKVVQS